MAGKTARTKKQKPKQAEVAKRAGIRQETVSRLESGKHAPTVRTVEKIDRVLADAVCEKSCADKTGKYQDQKGLTLPFVVGQEPTQG